jgi:hypothetical protein
MINLIDLTLWAQRIKDQCPAFGGRVFKTVPDDELAIDRHQTPVVFVYLPDDASGDNQINKGKAVVQRMASHVMIEVVLRRTATKTDHFDEAAVDSIRQYRLELFNALIGWQPADSVRPVRHVNGALNRKQPKLLKWADTFTTDNIITG